MVNDGMYFLNISSSDGLANSTNATFNISLDTVIPIISCNISNNTFARLNKTLQCDLSDSNPYNFTFRIWKSTSEYHLAINSSLDLANPTLLRIIRNINVTEDGNYTIELNGSDSVTRSPKIDDKLSKSKKSKTKFVLNDTLQAAFGDFTLLFYDKNGNGASASSVKSYSNYNEKGTRIHFGANFTAGDNNIIPTTISEIQKITKDLKLGMISKDVRTLQLFLINQNKGLKVCISPTTTLQAVHNHGAIHESLLPVTDGMSLRNMPRPIQ